jgi:signal peptidase I
VLRETLFLVVVAVVVAWLVRAFVAQAFFIPSGSMENTLLEGDRILVSKVGLWFGHVHRGDVVVFKDPGGWLPQGTTAGTPPVKRVLESLGLAPTPTEGDLVKRVIGVGGDHVVCCDNQDRVTVNGVPLDETYLFPGNSPSDSPVGVDGHFDVTVPAGYLWVMGDHRSVSEDSRARSPSKAMVPESDVIGRAVVIFWPVSRFHWISRPATFDNAAIDEAATAAP